MKYRNIATSEIVEAELCTDHPAASYVLAVPVIVGTGEAIDLLKWETVAEDGSRRDSGDAE